MSSRKASKERTRAKLIQATLKVLYKHGPSALTTGRIAEEAGVAQPTFYVHFSDMQDALTQAAEAVADKLLVRLKDYRDDLDASAPAESIRGAFAASVNALLSEPKMAELYLRHRRDVNTPLGKRWRQITQRARDDLRSDLETMGLAEHVEDLGIYAELIVGMTLTVTEGVLDKRIEDKDAAIDALVHVTQTSLMMAVSGNAAASATR